MMQVVVMDRFGGPDVLHLAERSRPEPGPGEVLVRVHCAGVNYIDALTRAGSGVPVARFPAVLGWDLAGTVVALGVGVTRFREGDAVFGMARFPALAEAYAEYLTAPVHELALKPASVPDANAASAPMITLTAWLALLSQGRLRAGQRVFIHGASGGVGHVAVQLARAAGAEVIGAASPAQHAFVTGLGATQVVDYAGDAVERAVRPVDLAVDHRGGDDFVRLLGVVRPGGAIATLKGADAAGERAAAARNIRVERIFVKPDGEVLEQVAGRLASGELRVAVGRTIPLAEASAAHSLVERARGGERIVLDATHGRATSDRI
jgi:NADPH:quinone reductase-like Zn-dependent oxidoreductase